MQGKRKEVRITVRITQEQYNFLCSFHSLGGISETVRWIIDLTRIMLDRGFYCKLIDCPYVRGLDECGIQTREQIEVSDKSL